MHKVGAPTPKIAPKHAKDGTGDQVSAENEENDDCLMACADEEIRQEQKCFMVRKSAVVNEKKVSPMFAENHDSG
jgi:hypothetical protein